MRPLLSLLLFLSLALPAQAYDLTLRDTQAEVYFSPRGGVEDAIVRHVDRAEDSVCVLAYSFTSGPITEALVRAHQRGVHVEVVLDRSQRSAKGGQVQTLAASGAPVYIDARHAIAHNKVMIIDGKTVVTGSFNFTKGAEEKNAENLLILDAPELAKLYRDEWEKHRGHAEG